MGKRVRTFGVHQRCESWPCHSPALSSSNKRHDAHLSGLLRGISKIKYLNPTHGRWLALNACPVPSPPVPDLLHQPQVGLVRGDGPCRSPAMLTLPGSPNQCHCTLRLPPQSSTKGVVSLCGRAASPVFLKEGLPGREAARKKSNPHWAPSCFEMQGPACNQG